MKSAQNAAISSNEKVFPIFAKKLASKDTKEFANTARKLAEWLGSEKAYYAAARPKIVELLEITLSAFMDTFVHLPGFAEFAELLRKLIQTVVRFEHLFTEPGLQSRLQRVIIDTERSLASLSHRIALPQGAGTATSPVLVSPLNVYLSPTMPAVLGPQKPTLLIQPISAQSNANAGVPDGAAHADAHLARNSAEVVSGQADAHPSPTSPVANTPYEPGEGVSPSSLPSKPQPKRTRKAVLSDELVARDLDWFKLNQASATANDESSKAGESSSLLTSDATHVPGWSSLPKKKTARIVPSRRLPRRVPLDAAQTAESDSLPPPSEPPTEPFEPTEDVSSPHADGQQPVLEKATPDARSATTPEVHDVQAVSPRELPCPHPQLPTPSTNGLPIEPDIPRTDHHSPSLNGESSIPPRASIPLPDVTLDGSDPMDISISDVGSEGVSPKLASSPPPQSPEVFQLRSPILPLPVDAWDPPLNMNFSISQIASDLPQDSPSDANRRRFDGEMSVIHSMQGKPFTHTHAIDISLEESMFTKISHWVNRRSRPSEAPRGVCISLACYRLPEVFSRVRSGGGKPDIEALMLQSPCSWPRSNRLSLHVHDGTRHTIVTLSPPLFLTPDQCVDVSSLMKPGNNTLEIKQYGDLSEHLVVLHAHRPTREQLSELDVVKIADERWQRFLDVLSARVVPGRGFTSSAGAVEV